MAKGYAKRVKDILLSHNCEFVRHGKGDHDIWQSPINNARFVVDQEDSLASPGECGVKAGRYQDESGLALQSSSIA